MPTAEPPRQPPNKYPRSALCTMPWVGAEMQERQNSVPPLEEFLGRQLKSWQPGMSVYTTPAARRSSLRATWDGTPGWALPGGERAGADWGGGPHSFDSPFPVPTARRAPGGVS